MKLAIYHFNLQCSLLFAPFQLVHFIIVIIDTAGVFCYFNRNRDLYRRILLTKHMDCRFAHFFPCIYTLICHTDYRFIIYCILKRKSWKELSIRQTDTFSHIYFPCSF